MTLITNLPKVKGEYRENTLLANTTWFGVGGVADILFKPADIEDLSNFLKKIDKNIPITILGLGSNLLVRDLGIRGVVIKLGRAFNYIKHDGNKITAGAATSDLFVSRYCLDHNISGLEFLSGIPGAIGGAVAMNAGAYGSDISTILDSVLAINMQGDIYELSNSELQFSYRKYNYPEQLIFLEARFSGELSVAKIIKEKMDLINKNRVQSQPIKQKTGGSTFKNPAGNIKAWELIDNANCRGLTVGRAQMSEQHCNFMINLGNATANELETLGEVVRQKVFEKSAVKLEWEIKRIGAKDE